MSERDRTINELNITQQSFFDSGMTRALDFRREQLKKLLRLVTDHEDEISAALKSDLGKPLFEAYGSEIVFVKQEILHTLKHLRHWAKPRKVAVPLPFQPGSAHIYPEPFGRVLVMAPWNYPFQLLLSPAVGAISAGNVVVLKPSELAPHTSKLIHDLITDNFDPGLIAVLEGGLEVNQSLLEKRFDYIFFTGSPQVGKIVMSQASRHLTPVTLELGGKSPCLVDRSADLEIAARRIAWGKFYNAGQTCVAPDYLVVHASIKNDLVVHLRKAVETFYGSQPQRSPDYGRIVNDRHFQRLASYLSQGEILFGGQHSASERYLAPTLIEPRSLEQPLMQEEIFGPILPMLTVTDMRDSLDLIQRQSQPLALYLFTKDKTLERKILNDVAFGGGCVNDTLVHLGIPNLPFGGVGRSGIGGYHGEHSFRTFSHQKSVYRRSWWPDLPLRYPPYKGKLKWLKKALG